MSRSNIYHNIRFVDYFILLSWLIQRTQHYSVEYYTIFQLFQHMTDWTSDSTIQSVSYEQCPYSSVQRSCVILNITTTAAHVCKSPNFSSHYRLCPFTPRRTLFLNTNCQNIFLHKFNKILKQKFFNKIFVVSQPLWRFLPLFNLQITLCVIEKYFHVHPQPALCVCRWRAAM